MEKRNYLKWMAVLFIAGFVFIGVVAQTADAPPAAAAAAKKGTFDTTLWGLWVTGGWSMYPLGALSIATVALTIYGFLISRTDKMLPTEIVSSVQSSLENTNVEEAMTICSGTPCLLTNILGAGLQRISHGVLDVPAMEKAMEEASVEETSSGLKTISYLSIIAALAPMLGLLGTVSGMIKAFQKIGMGGMGDPERLAQDIGEAMITTAFGLIIGIPAMFFYFYLKSKYIGNISRLARILGNLTHGLVVSTTRPQAAAPEKAE